jgi:hypothetical protein
VDDFPVPPVLPQLISPTDCADCRNRRSIIFRPAFAIGLVLIIALSTRASDPPPRGATDTARQYTRLFEEGRSSEAFERMWDYDRFQQIVFKKDLDDCTAEERKIMADRFRFLVPKLVVPAGQSLKNISHTRFQEKSMSDNLAAVRYLVRFGDGSTAPNTLILQRSGENWSVVNFGSGGDAELVAAKLRKDYLKSKLKPAEFTNALLKKNDGN